MNSDLDLSEWDDIHWELGTQITLGVVAQPSFQVTPNDMWRGGNRDYMLVGIVMALSAIGSSPVVNVNSWPTPSHRIAQLVIPGVDYDSLGAGGVGDFTTPLIPLMYVLSHDETARAVEGADKGWIAITPASGMTFTYVSALWATRSRR